ncbi:T-lymphocyte surface antigen Ly-9-like [Etheostoma spectabile]|uniref:T-lymphocyte surface antigen Ly-9-like n=1 Tax=Etheostoma spectabile TaxID=54343 RepID=UPI0013AE92E2|nr:T-lymphocyte surface antigen Ly-9-like [Etheostoma spectabile]
MEKLLFLLLLAVLNVARAQDKSTPKYYKDGGVLTLDLSPRPSEPITNLVWKHQGNLVVAKWVKDEVLSYFKTFIGRATVDVTTGRLVINNMTKADMGVYSVELNYKVQNERYDAILIKEVPEPMVWVRPWMCPSALDRCTLSCEGVTTNDGPVTYSWKKGDGDWTESGKYLDITKEERADVETFTCRIQNPVSARQSRPKENPFLIQEPGSSNVKTIVGVIFVLLVVVAVVVAAAAVALCCCNNRGYNRPGMPTGSTVQHVQPPGVAPPSGTEPLPDNCSTCLKINTAGCWTKEGFGCGRKTQI